MGPDQPRVGHDLQPPDKSWHGSSEPTWEGTKSLPALLTCLSSSPADSKPPGPIKLVFSRMNLHFFSPSIAFLETQFLWCWPLPIADLTEAIKYGWLIDLQLFRECWLIPIHLRVVKCIQEIDCYGLEGLLVSLTIPENSSPNTDLIIIIPPSSLVGFACNSTPHQTKLNT